MSEAKMTTVNVKTGEVTIEPDPDYTPPTPEEILAAKRAAATLKRGAFLVAAVSAGIVTEATAEEAADGSWPAGFDAFLTGLTGAQRIEAKATWADGNEVSRSNPILLAIAATENVTDAQLDALFGIEL